jgi:hypothetical protein
LRRAIRLVAQPDASPEERILHGRATVTLAYPTFERHGLAPALALLDEAEHLVEGAPGAPVRALASVQRAGFLGRSGDWASAVTILVDAERDAESLTPRERCALLLNRGMARLYLHDLRGCRQDLEASLAVATTQGFDDLAFKARHNLGCLEFLRGDLPTALRRMGEADGMDVEVARATAKLDFARVLLEAGLLDRAAILLDEALTIARARGLWQEVGEILLDQARHAVITGDYQTARARASAARRTFGRRAAVGWRLQAEMLRLEAELATDRRRPAVALAAEGLAAQALPSQALAHQAAMLAAEAALANGDLSHAAAWLTRRPAPRHLTFSTQLHGALVLARLDAVLGDSPSATHRLRETARRLAEEQGRHSSLDTRTALALHGRRLSDLDLEIAEASGSAASVFAASERWRAASQRVAPIRPPDDDQLAALTSRLRQARGELRDQPDGGSAESLVAEATRLELEVSRRGWELSRRQGGPDWSLRPVSLSAVRRAAHAADSDVVAFTSRRNRLLAVVVERSRARVVDVASLSLVVDLTHRIAADLGALGRPVPEALRSLVERSLERGFADIDRLLAPALPRRRSRLLVLPSQTLASLPWRQLPSLAGRPVVVAPSATFWVRAMERLAPAGMPRTAAPRTAAPPRLTAVAGPGLARAASESRAVAALWGSVAALEPSTATGADLVRALGSGGVVHVAAHGMHHEQSPLFSAIALSDGPVFAYEFDGGGSPARHVVLSACEVGRAVVRPGEEALGLTASLLARGVDCVVAALGPVGDEAAERAMTAYHRELVGGADAALALERATETTPEARMFCTFGSAWHRP